MKDVSVIIVNYNCAAYICDCIQSVYDQTSGISFEVLVTDNQSADNSLDLIRNRFPEVKLIEAGANLGFGMANNLGAKTAKGKYLLLLNPDTILLNNALKLFYDFMENNSGIGCCGGNLLDEHRQPANLGGNFPSLFQLFSDIGFRVLYPDYYKRKVSLMLTKPTLPDDKMIDCVCGADLFISKELFESVGGFDKSYFLYYEDTDLCFRLKKMGLQNCIVQDAEIIHLESAATVDNRADRLNEKKFTFFEKGKQLFFKKSFGRLSLSLAKFLTIFYILSRWAAHKGSLSKYIKLIGISLKMKLD